MIDPASASDRIEYPRAIAAKSSIQATTIINASPYFAKTVEKCLMDVPDMLYSVCLCSAAEVYATGMLATAHDAVVDLAPEKRSNSKVRRKIQIKELKNQRGKIIVQLQAVGILPTGFGWLIVKWFVIPFLLELLKEWSIGPDEDGELKDGE
jgi:hypothetical protein